MDSSTFITVAILLVIGWFIASRMSGAKGLKAWNDDEFQRELSSSSAPMLIDVREPNEYKSGYIPGARNIPLSQLNRRLAEIPQDRDLFLYCRSGMRSTNAARILHKHGYTKLSHLKGGIGAWSGKIAK